MTDLSPATTLDAPSKRRRPMLQEVQKERDKRKAAEARAERAEQALAQMTESVRALQNSSPDIKRTFLLGRLVERTGCLPANGKWSDYYQLPAEARQKVEAIMRLTRG